MKKVVLFLVMFVFLSSFVLSPPTCNSGDGYIILDGEETCCDTYLEEARINDRTCEDACSYISEYTDLCQFFPLDYSDTATEICSNSLDDDGDGDIDCADRNCRNDCSVCMDIQLVGELPDDSNNDQFRLLRSIREATCESVSCYFHGHSETDRYDVCVGTPSTCLSGFSEDICSSVPGCQFVGGVCVEEGSGDTETCGGDCVGGDGGASVTLTCPEGSFVTGVFGRSGHWLDQLGLICSDGERSDPAGGSGGSDAFEAECPDGTTLTGLGAYTSESGNYVSQIVLDCDGLDNAGFVN